MPNTETREHRENIVYRITRKDSQRFIEQDYRNLFGTINPIKYNGFMVTYTSGEKLHLDDRLEATEVTLEMGAEIENADCIKIYHSYAMLVERIRRAPKTMEKSMVEKHLESFRNRKRGIATPQQ